MRTIEDATSPLDGRHGPSGGSRDAFPALFKPPILHFPTGYAHEGGCEYPCASRFRRLHDRYRINGWAGSNRASALISDFELYAVPLEIVARMMVAQGVSMTQIETISSMLAGTLENEKVRPLSREPTHFA